MKTFFLLNLLLLPLFAASEVKIETDAQGQHTLLRNGQPYLVKGANWPTTTTIQALAEAGGNSIRTYANEVIWMLPLAKKYQMSVMFGLHIGREREGFDYADQKAVDQQFEKLRATVRQYKNESEVLIWAIGNEPEMHAKQTVLLFKEINRIARMIHEEDPHHPVVTVIAGFDQNKIKQLLDHCPDLDALGVNWYGSAIKWPDDLKKFGWTKPYLHTEFGPTGYWPGAEGSYGLTKWGAPIEQTSSEKALLYSENWRNAVVARPGQSLGGYAFIWGPKQERTQTWFSMHLFTGERTALVDAMQMAWTGIAPKNRAPEILEWKPERSEFKPGETAKIAFTWKCDRSTKLTIETRTETTATQSGGDKEPEPIILPRTSWKEVPGGIEVTVPDQPGKYRIFALITTKDQTAATANLPILVN